MHELSTLSIECLGQFPTSVNIKSPISLTLASSTILTLWSKFKIQNPKTCTTFLVPELLVLCVVSIANKLGFFRD